MRVNLKEKHTRTSRFTITKIPKHIFHCVKYCTSYYSRTISNCIPYINIFIIIISVCLTGIKLFPDFNYMFSENVKDPETRRKISWSFKFCILHTKCNLAGLLEITIVHDMTALFHYTTAFICYMYDKVCIHKQNEKELIKLCLLSPS